MTATHTTAYTRAHSLTFLSDNMRTALREIIRENGLDPDKLMNSWETIERGILAWTVSGHLNRVTVEFFQSGSTLLEARWDFPVRYTGSGIDDDMWLDKAYLRQLVAKSARPSPRCTYRITLNTSNGAPHVDGFSDCTLLDTAHLASRAAGTAIATGHLTADVTYWR